MWKAEENTKSIGGIKMSGLGATASSITRTIIHLPLFTKVKTALFIPGSRGSRQPAQLTRPSDFTLARTYPIELWQLKNKKASASPKDPIRLDVSLAELMEADNEEIDSDEVANQEAVLELPLADTHEAIDSPPALPFQDLHLIPGYKIGGRYRLQGTLGNGGMGSVYLGFDEVNKNWVAIKVANNIENRHLIADEIKTMLDLGDDQRLVRCLASGINFIVLELIEGKTLVDFVNVYRPDKNDYDLNSYRAAFLKYTVKTLKIVREIFKGLEYAHGRDVIHADLTLDNVMLLQGSGVKILDFGLSELVKRAIPNTLFGKPYAMSPEQARAEQLDGRTDIYAAGIILYRMLTRRKPYQIPAHGRMFPKQDTMVEILLRKQKDDIFGYPLPSVDRSQILNIFGNDNSSWGSFFVDPNRSKLTFKPDAEEIINSRVEDETTKADLLFLLADANRRLAESVPFYYLADGLREVLGNDIGERVYNLFDKMTAADREERFQTATEARLAVEAILEDIEDNPPLF
jgi:serine/threonine protein kinase